ncbi:PqqD family protein [Epibacterium ulvae]|uniref:PqqD family protein n=1 Tax=Epibacterium ulvae TaxID=1156985 RepID=UPI0024901EEE|nr:PqqD family protein [Epibacterium ulvae]
MTLFQIKPNVVDTDIGGDRALLDLDQNTYFTLNPTAATIWAALETPQSVNGLIEAVIEKFDINPEQCRPDIEHMLQDMLDAHIVEQVNG